MYAKLKFDRCDEAFDETQVDVDRLASSVMNAFNRHFEGYDQAAAALAEYRRVKAEVEADPTMNMFGALEAFEAAMAAHPDASGWRKFENEAAAAIAPFCFSMKFSND